nr:YIP1 family protein [Caldicellulosiruptor bescii]
MKVELKSIKRSIVLIFAISLIFQIISTTKVYAYIIEDMREVPYYQYNYDVYQHEIPSAAGYYPAKTIRGEYIGSGSFKNPTDLYVDNNNTIYIMDSGNKRVIVCDKDFKLKKIIDKFFDSNGTIQLIEPDGIFVDKSGLIYICDKGSKLVWIFNQDGKLIRTIEKPVSDLKAAKKDFIPFKVVVDNAGIIYVLSLGSFEGAYMFDQNGNFLGFYGSNKVVVTWQLLVDRFWKSILTKEQKSSMVRYLPTECTSIDIAKDGFIYTCSNYTDVSEGEIRKLNYLGENILWYKKQGRTRDYGDISKYQGKELEDSYFIDIDVTDDGFINALDYERGRIFQYDQNANLLFICGGKGDQVGTFKDPVAIDSIANDLVVLDKLKGTITVFKETKLGSLVHKATLLYNEGKYDDARHLWEQVHKMDFNFSLAHVGLGKALLRMDKYSDAMYYFRLANDKDGYSEAKEVLRNEFLKRNFGVIATTVIAIIVLLYVLIKRFRKPPTAQDIYTKKIDKYKYPLHVMLHPFRGFEELKEERKGSVIIATFIVFIFFVTMVINRQYTGFIFNPYRQDKINILSIFSSTVGIFFFWVLSNWMVSTLTEGEGKFGEIWVFSAYSLTPYIICTLLAVVMSQFMIAEEAMFINFVRLIGTLWLVICIFNAIKSVHQYTPSKTIGTIALSVLGVGIILFIIVLMLTLFGQLIDFINNVYSEILLRI